MSVNQGFAEFIRRIRSGDAEAAADLIRRYEPAIRLEVRMRISDPRLCRLFDSMDICQSVLASFFVRAASGQFDLNDPDQLLRLLVAITRNKVAYQARWHGSRRRDYRRGIELDYGLPVAVAGGHEPSRLVAGRELLDEFLKRMTEDERRVADLRAKGSDWAEIAGELGGTPQARRKQLSRAVDRIERELGMDR
jgi:RNA polymerase sigma-70 factor (ECF subfamily)